MENGIEDSVERRRRYFEEKSDYTPEVRLELQVDIGPIQRTTSMKVYSKNPIPNRGYGNP